MWSLIYNNYCIFLFLFSQKLLWETILNIFFYCFVSFNSAHMLSNKNYLFSLFILLVFTIPYPRFRRLLVFIFMTIVFIIIFCQWKLHFVLKNISSLKLFFFGLIFFIFSFLLKNISFFNLRCKKNCPLQ